jgi:hypothetical protein
LFLGINDVEEDALASTQNANRRLISLLNSLVYPEADNDTSKEHIIAVEIVDGTIITHEKLGDSKTKTNSGHENALKELRCDIVCKCKLGSNVASQTANNLCVLYFDIEMQRKNIKHRMDDFLAYQQNLQERYRQPVKVIAFLDYTTGKAVEFTRMAREVMGKDGHPVPAQDQVDVPFQPMIGLKAAVEDILSGKTIVIIDEKVIGNAGKEWLKLLGIRWWARRMQKNPTCEYYVVPSDVRSDSVKEAFSILQKDKINDEAFQIDVNRVFNAKKTIDNIREDGREEGEAIGILKMLGNCFITGGVEILDMVIPSCGIGENSLDESFAREVWGQLSNVPDTKNVDDFIQILRDKGLIKE